MALTLTEFMTWTDMSILELWVYIASLLCTSILMALKLHEVLLCSTMAVFMPLFVGIAINSYILFVVFMRSYVEYKTMRGPFLKMFVNSLRTGLIGLFYFFVAKKIEGTLEADMPKADMEFSVTFLPLWLLMAVLAMQVCRSSNH